MKTEYDLYFDLDAETDFVTVKVIDIATEEVLASKQVFQGSHHITYQTSASSGTSIEWQTQASQIFSLTYVVNKKWDDTRLADVLIFSDFYNFHSRKPGRSLNLGDYRFGASNGQEMIDEISGTSNHYTAEFWEYNPRIVHRWNRDPKGHPSFSPYAIMQGNPIMYSDVHGDSVDIANLKDKNEDGSYMYEKELRAFEEFAATDDGRKYIEDHAQAGFEYEGVFNKDLNISVDKDGASHKKGVDAEFRIGGLDVSYNSAEAHMKVVEGRLKLSYRMDNTVMYGPEDVYTSAKNWGHEVFYHGDFYEKRFLSLTPSQRTFDNIYSRQNYYHTLPRNSTRWEQIGVRYLKQIRSKMNLPNVSNDNLKKEINRGLGH